MWQRLHKAPAAACVDGMRQEKPREVRRLDQEHGEAQMGAQRQSEKLVRGEPRCIGTADAEQHLVRGNRARQPTREPAAIQRGTVGCGHGTREHRVAVRLVAIVVRWRHARLGWRRVVIVMRAARMARRAAARLDMAGCQCVLVMGAAADLNVRQHGR